MGGGGVRVSGTLHGQYGAESIGRRHALGGAEGWGGGCARWEGEGLDATGGSVAVHGP